MSKEISSTEFAQLLLACQEISSFAPDGIVFIGGIAVYFHAINQEQTKSLAEFTHDADLYISIPDMSDLRDLEEVTANRRLNKHQLVKRGFEFDIYTERHSSLVVPYDQIRAHAVKYDSLHVAALEHLLVLKLEAYQERQHSAKGEKDAKDLIRIGLVAKSQKRKLNLKLMEGYLSDNHIALLEKVRRGPEMLALAKGNAKLAKSYREEFSEAVEGLVKSYKM